MALIESPVDLERERQQELEDQQLHVMLKREAQAHEIALANLKIVQQGKVKRYARRLEMQERIVVGVLKLVPILLLSLLVPLLLLFKRDIPKFLQDFMSL